MKQLFVFCLIVGLGLCFIAASGDRVQDVNLYPVTVKETPDNPASKMVKRDPDFGKIPLYFIPNQGQVDEKARFYAKTSRYMLWMTKEGLVFDSISKVEATHPAPSGHPSQEKHTPPFGHPSQEGSKRLPHSPHSPYSPYSPKSERDVSRLIFRDANSNPGIVPLELAQHKVNYFKGRDQSKWRTGIQTSKAVLYKGLYKGIDLKVYGVEKQVEYDWVVKPGADPGKISFEYKNVKAATIDDEGNLVIETIFGKLMHKKPVSYQLIEGKRVRVESVFRETRKNTYGFMVKEYNRDYELIIDPMVCPIYSTYLGGSGYEYYIGDKGEDIAVDSNQYSYVTGCTFSIDFPIKNPYQPEIGFADAFVVKISPIGELEYSTYLGGDSFDSGHGIAVDSSGNAYVTGETYGMDFPTKDPYQPWYRGWSDGFITKLSPTGDSLVYSTYLGGSDVDFSYGIVVDSQESAYVTGLTWSEDFPTKNPFQDVFGGGYGDAFVTKLSPTGSSLVYSTYLGGESDDSGNGIIVDSHGSAYVTGGTSSSSPSSNFPTKNAYQETLDGGSDAFVTKFSPTGKYLLYSTYLGGSGADGGWSIALDSHENVYVTGKTSSSNFPVANAYQETYGGNWDAFVTKLTPSGNVLSYSTYLGGSGSENGCDIAVDSNRNTYVTGYTTITDFPTHNAWQSSLAGGDDAFVARFCSCDSEPVLVVNKTLFNFAKNNWGDTTDSQSFLIRNIGEGTLNWSVSDDVDWLTCSPESGTNFGEVTVSVDASGLEPCTYTGTITVSDANAINSPQTIPVTLRVYGPKGPHPLTARPFGFFETPGEGATVRGSVPFTGWALDDIEVVSVKLCLGNCKDSTYIGEATFVEGARPDVAQVYPEYPYSNRAGWGYLMLTNALDDGTYVVHAEAGDREGNWVTLGTKTITIDNANAVKPFGTIDTPTPGGTASGSDYKVFGWALTPIDKTIPEDGIDVYVDGVNLGKANYGLPRTDVCLLFPGFNNCPGPGFYFDLNTTACDNGMHTIQCVVTDNENETDGIGSRYFYAWNLGTINSLSQTSIRKYHLMTEIADIPVDYWGPVRIKRGYCKEDDSQVIYPDDNGIINVEIKELERIMVRLNPSGPTRPGDRESREKDPRFEQQKAVVPTRDHQFEYTGYLVMGDQLWSLPIGSSLNTKRGIFYWQPGVAYFGEYQLVFVGKGPDGEMKKKLMNVKIVPKFSL